MWNRNSKKSLKRGKIEWDLETSMGLVFMRVASIVEEEEEEGGGGEDAKRWQKAAAAGLRKWWWPSTRATAVTTPSSGCSPTSATPFPRRPSSSSPCRPSPTSPTWAPPRLAPHVRRSGPDLAPCDCYREFYRDSYQFGEIVLRD